MEKSKSQNKETENIPEIVTKYDLGDTLDFTCPGCDCYVSYFFLECDTQSVVYCPACGQKVKVTKTI